VSAGLINPEYFLGGAMRLDAQAAERAIRSHVSDPLGWTDEQTLANVQTLAVGRMADALRAISVRRGYDPRDFTLVAYGGATALFAAAIGIELGADDVLIPAQASVFSAFGLLWADARRVAVRTVNWDVEHGAADDLRRAADDLLGRARAGLDGHDAIRVRLEADCKFAGQAYEVTVPIDAPPVTEGDRKDLTTRFVARYEALYGPGTAWEDTPVVLLTLRAIAEADVPRPNLRADHASAPDAPHPPAVRRIVLPSGPADARILRGEDLRSGTVVDGPAVVEDLDTTVVVPPGVTLTVDEYANHRLDLRSAR
jgi:N-methylhydantoinase A